MRLENVGARDAPLLRGGAGDGFLIGELRLIQAALCNLQRVCGLVEALERRIAGSRQLLDAIVSLLGERQIRSGAFDLGLALRDHLGAGAGQDIGELGGGDRQSGFRFLQLCQQFRIVDLV